MSRFEFNNVAVKSPNLFYPTGATTSTEDSGRTQDLEMHNSVMGTIESYHFEWKNIYIEEAATIINQIKNKNRYDLKYVSPSLGSWTTNKFYTSNYNLGTLKKVNGRDAWESLSFDAISIFAV